jgi:hypothetical protein
VEPLPRKRFNSDLAEWINGAGDETRTRDIQLGRLALYQLSYSRVPYMVPAAHTQDVPVVG